MDYFFIVQYIRRRALNSLAFNSLSFAVSLRHIYNTRRNSQKGDRHQYSSFRRRHNRDAMHMIRHACKVFTRGRHCHVISSEMREHTCCWVMITATNISLLCFFFFKYPEDRLAKCSINPKIGRYQQLKCIQIVPFEMIGPFFVFVVGRETLSWRILQRRGCCHFRHAI